MAAQTRFPRLKTADRKRSLILTLIAAASIAGCTSSAATAAGSEIFGTWLRDDGNARVRVAPCGESICATNLWIRDPKRQGEKIGDRLEFNIKRDGSGWRGKAYDPQRKLNFSATLSAAGDAMTTEGCIAVGLICRTTRWQRLPPATAAQ
ncbi:hypothetical protein ASD45_15830 [Pseudolabrys sp. Root1462]|jgi:uncharacterized protein (DUF2147 family)|nr:hypothetical protein ASD45_15830 [Pseudolabrys sp. Root1462]